MRRLAVFLGIAILAVSFSANAALPAQSNTPGQQTAPGPHNFGGLNCPQRVPCPDSDVKLPSAQDLAANANACVSQYLGMTSPDGFFDQDLGLDSNNCLRNNSTSQRLSSQRTTPHCCITKASDNTCMFRCDLMQ